MGHSQIIVKKDANGFTVFESNIKITSNKRGSREKYYTWDQYVKTWYNANHQYIKYIKWPDAGTYNPQSLTQNTNNNTAGEKNYSTIANGVYSLTPKCAPKLRLDINGGSSSNGANAQIWSANNSNAQKFDFYYLGNGYYRITSKSSGKALDVNGGSSASGTNVQQWSQNGGNGQQWKLVDAGDGYYVIPRVSESLRLDVDHSGTSNGTNVQVWTKNSSNAQKWMISKADAYSVIDEGVYTLSPKCSPKQRLDISSGSRSDGANAQLWAANNNPQQKFKFSYLGNGYYSITAYHSGKVLDVNGGSSTSGTNVQQWSQNGENGQQWKLVDAGGGYYYVIPRVNESLRLDVNNSGTSNGTNVQVWTMNSSNAQKWMISKADAYSVIDEGVYALSPKCSPKQRLDISSGSRSDGANAQLWAANNNPQQKFKFSYLGNGYYSITVYHSGKALDVNGGSSASGTNVQQWSQNGRNCQQWKLVDAGGGYYYVIPRVNESLRLDVNNSGTSNGTNVQVWTMNSSNAQKWMITKAKT